MNFLDLRSDTTTKPTEEMRKAMANAEVDDDVYGDDPTINRLEALAGEIMGKEAALFVPSGTMGNQLAIMTHTSRGEEIIAGTDSHIVRFEGGAPAILSGVNLSLVENADTYIYPEDIKRKVRPSGNLHYPKTSLLCLENALCNGDVMPMEIMKNSYQTAKDLGLLVHLDGARIFNAALALGVSAKEIADCADSVMFCISKGLCSPVGSLLCGSKEFIDKARYNRKILGGGMRQAGVLAACGLISLTTMVERLHEDHENARLLGEMLSEIDGITSDLSKVKINMVFFKVDIDGFKEADFVKFMHENGVKIYGEMAGEYRFVTSNNVNRDDVKNIVTLVADYAAKVR